MKPTMTLLLALYVIVRAPASAAGRFFPLREELADVFYFTVRFSQVTWIDLYPALVGKIAKNAEKYPAETSKGSNRKYDE